MSVNHTNQKRVNRRRKEFVNKNKLSSKSNFDIAFDMVISRYKVYIFVGVILAFVSNYVFGRDKLLINLLQVFLIDNFGSYINVNYNFCIAFIFICIGYLFLLIPHSFIVIKWLLKNKPRPVKELSRKEWWVLFFTALAIFPITVIAPWGILFFGEYRYGPYFADSLYNIFLKGELSLIFGGWIVLFVGMVSLVAVYGGVLGIIEAAKKDI